MSLAVPEIMLSLVHAGLNSILSIVPDVIFIAIALIRLWYLIHQPTKLSRPSYFQCTFKLAASILVLASTSTMVGLMRLHQASLRLPRIGFVDSVLSLVAAV